MHQKTNCIYLCPRYWLLGVVKSKKLWNLLFPLCYLELRYLRAQSKKNRISSEDRVWGRWTVIEEREKFKVKKLEVLPKKKTSYQKHIRRSEQWIVLKGEGIATLNGKKTSICYGGSINVPLGEWHQLENTGEGILACLEVQFGEYLGEDDILRL